MKERFQLVHIRVNGVHSYRIDAVGPGNSRRTQKSWKFTNRSIPLAELKQTAEAKLERLRNPQQHQEQVKGHSRIQAAIRELLAALKEANLWS